MSFSPEMMMMMQMMQNTSTNQQRSNNGGSYLDKPFYHPNYSNQQNYTNREVQAMANLLAAKALDEAKCTTTTTTTTNVQMQPQQLTNPFQTSQSTAIVTTAPKFAFDQKNDPPVTQMAGQVLSELKEMRSVILEQQDDIADIREMSEFSLAMSAKQLKVSSQLAQKTDATDVLQEIEMYEAESASFLSQMQKKRELAWAARMKPTRSITNSPNSVRLTEVSIIEDDEERPRKLPKTPVRSARPKPNPKSTPKSTPKKPANIRLSLEEKYNNNEEVPDSADEMLT